MYNYTSALCQRTLVMRWDPKGLKKTSRKRKRDSIGYLAGKPSSCVWVWTHTDTHTWGRFFQGNIVDCVHYFVIFKGLLIEFQYWINFEYTVNIKTVCIFAKTTVCLINDECSSWYTGVGKFLVSVWNRRKQCLYVAGSACMAWQNSPTPECVVNGTECYDGWVWAVYLFIYLLGNILRFPGKFSR